MDFERCQVSDLQMYMMALVTQKRKALVLTCSSVVKQD